MKAGKHTSEYRLAKVTKWVNIVVAGAGGIMTAIDPETPAYAILAGIVAGSGAWVSATYTKARRDVKAEEIRAGVAT